MAPAPAQYDQLELDDLLLFFGALGFSSGNTENIPTGKSMFLLHVKALGFWLTARVQVSQNGLSVPL